MNWIEENMIEFNRIMNEPENKAKMFGAMLKMYAPELIPERVRGNDVSRIDEFIDVMCQELADPAKRRTLAGVALRIKIRNRVGWYNAMLLGFFKDNVVRIKKYMQILGHETPGQRLSGPSAEEIS